MLTGHSNLEFLHKSSDEHQAFEKKYIQTRNKEHRLLSDEEVSSLPNVSQDNLHAKEWSVRKKSFSRLINYLKNLDGHEMMLDIGCGNGCFAAGIAKNFPNRDIHGIDVNETELRQAARVFSISNLNFYYGDILRRDIDLPGYDLIFLNAAIQYFPRLDRLLDRCFGKLKANGEIHILDSPVYENDQAAKAAKKRTIEYFKKISIESPFHYYHHTFDGLRGFNWNLMYNPKSFVNRVRTRLFEKDIPFPWIKVDKK